MGNPRPSLRGDPRRFLLVAFAGISWLIWPRIGVTGSDPSILSLHGMTSMDRNVGLETYRAGDSVTESEIWAKGDLVRHEIANGDGKLIQIQRGELIYSFSAEDAFGMVIRVRRGLGTMGLVRQIEEIRAHGDVIRRQDAFFDTSQLPDEAEYDVYRYEDRLTGEVVNVALTHAGSIPRIWVGLLPNQNVTVIHYWDMEANVEISDSLFNVPEKIDLSATSVCEVAQQEGDEQLQQTCNAAISGDMAAQGALGFFYFQVAERLEAGPAAQEYRGAAWWYRKAAMQGHTSSQHNIGFLYLQGLGVERDYERAIRWFRVAAEKEYPPSEYNLGKAYMDGLGVTEDYEIANHWLLGAAKHGYAAAQFDLGLNYLRGLGVERNSEEAYAWLATAAAQGFDLGALDLSPILADMTIDQRGRAEELASTYRKKYCLVQR